MSANYCARRERERGPHPSEQMIAPIAQGLHLSLDERDHLFRFAGHRPPVRGGAGRRCGKCLERRADRRSDRLPRPVPQHRLSLVHRSRRPGAFCARTWAALR
ncbi:hypothetical protein ACFQ1L_35735 [Phytohabitans flavus]|uniref:hypothetical protein n=1 Tax=Phytohabitans flavus TaxID=1076124 RepID=UPI003635EC06